MTEVTYFFGFGFVSLSVLVPILALVWAYEDAGLRRYDNKENTLSKVGTWIVQFFVGTGVASAFLKFVLSLSGGTAVAGGAVLALIIVLIFPCLIVTLLYHRQWHAKYVRKLLVSRTAQELRRKALTITDGSQNS